MVKLVTTLSGHRDSWAHRFVRTCGIAIQKMNDFFFYYGHEYVSSVAFPGLVREPGCNECGPYSSVTVLACARALGGTVIKLEQFV